MKLPDMYHERIRPELTAKRGWMAIAAVVAIHDIACSDGEMLSEGIDRVLESNYRFAAIGGVAVTAAHLLNLLPEQIDPIHQIAEVARRVVQ